MLIRLKQLFFKTGNTTPEQAYNLWAKGYDNQPDNLMLALDEIVFSALMQQTEIGGSIIVDVGCGTGRHWKKILLNEPQELIGYDVSGEMLEILLQKYPRAEVHKMADNRLNGLADNSVDIVISTLTIAHIKNAYKALEEWNRVVKPGGTIVLTDYHPEALQKGGKRTFKYDNKTVSIKNHIHSIKKLNDISRQLHWKQIRFMEKKIDESVKYYYERQNALATFNAFKGVPIIYGMLFKKKDVT